jgi:hypothetical protein
MGFEVEGRLQVVADRFFAAQAEHAWGEAARVQQCPAARVRIRRRSHSLRLVPHAEIDRAVDDDFILCGYDRTACDCHCCESEAFFHAVGTDRDGALSAMSGKRSGRSVAGA